MRVLIKDFFFLLILYNCISYVGGMSFVLLCLCVTQTHLDCVSLSVAHTITYLPQDVKFNTDILSGKDGASGFPPI